MSDPIFDFPSPFTAKKRATHIEITPVSAQSFTAWVKKQPDLIKNHLKATGFEGRAGQNTAYYTKDGKIAGILAGVSSPVKLYDFALTADFIGRALSDDFLKGASFSIATKGLSKKDIENAHIGWGLASYQYTAYKPTRREKPALVAGGIDQNRVLAHLQSTFILRNLVNTPSNDLGPAELAKAALTIAKQYGAKTRVIKDEELLEENFPMVYAVGDSSARRPCLIDFTWGKAKDPKVTLVGKGVCFDTGGLDIKPSSAMAIMKKDMGGAAHALAVARMIMALNIPVRLRVIIPAVENAVSGTAFRPGDIFTSRKGLTIENTNTDAEGRLILSDCLTLASEEKPDLIIDFATLTGSARAGLGPDIPPIFSNNEKLADRLQKLSFEVEDPVWAMPLWPPYAKVIESPVADLINSAGTPGDLMYSALFLERFLVGTPDWIHIDCYAWELGGRPGRPRGGADTSLRAVFAFIEDRYAKK